MTKGYKKSFVKAQEKNGDEDQPKGPIEHTTSRGVHMQLVGLPQLLLDNIRNSVPKPSVPTYTVHVDETNADIVLPYDEKSVQTEQEKAMWADYQAKLAAAEKIVNDRLTDATLLKGVIVELPEDDNWIKEQQFLGATVPVDNPMKLYIHYIRTEAISGDADLRAITLKILEATGVGEEALDEVRKSFRNQAQKRADTVRTALDKQ